MAHPPLPNFAISESDSFEVPGRPGFFCTYYPKGQTATILSIQENGDFDTRPASAAGGPWETWVSEDGNRAVFHDTAYHQAFPLVG